MSEREARERKSIALQKDKAVQLDAKKDPQREKKKRKSGMTRNKNTACCVAKTTERHERAVQRDAKKDVCTAKKKETKTKSAEKITKSRRCKQKHRHNAKQNTACHAAKRKRRLERAARRDAKKDLCTAKKKKAKTKSAEKK